MKPPPRANAVLTVRERQAYRRWIAAGEPSRCRCRLRARSSRTSRVRARVRREVGSVP